MPGSHVALLRGINVGKAKRVGMAELRALFEALGYRDIRTLLNSGNVVFSAPARGDPSARMEQAFAKKFGFSSRFTVLTAAEIATVVRENPLGGVAEDPSRYQVTVLANPRDRAKLLPLARQRWAPDAFAVGKRVAYLWCPDGIIDSLLAEAVFKLLGDAATTRNWATISKLHALLSAGAQ